jgi:hypothetical protein
MIRGAAVTGRPDSVAQLRIWIVMGTLTRATRRSAWSGSTLRDVRRRRERLS